MSRIRYKFTGAGFVVGLPARDIRDDELTPEMEKEIEANMENSPSNPAYKRVGSTDTKPAESKKAATKDGA